MLKMSRYFFKGLAFVVVLFFVIQEVKAQSDVSYTPSSGYRKKLKKKLKEILVPETPLRKRTQLESLLTGDEIFDGFEREVKSMGFEPNDMAVILALSQIKAYEVVNATKISDEGIRAVYAQCAKQFGPESDWIYTPSKSKQGYFDELIVRRYWMGQLYNSYTEEKDARMLGMIKAKAKSWLAEMLESNGAKVELVKEGLVIATALDGVNNDRDQH